jgi:hypothetical protein
MARIEIKPRRVRRVLDPALVPMARARLKQLGEEVVKKFKSQIREQGGRARVEIPDHETIVVKTYDISEALHLKIKRALRKLEE